jgi:cold shock CspA family protein
LARAPDFDVWLQRFPYKLAETPQAGWDNLMRYGTIVQYFDDKGYGFIRPDVGPNIFFHITALGACDPQRQIKLGQPVKYELIPNTELQARRQARRDDEESAKPSPPLRAQAKLVELIDKIPGATLDDVTKRPRSTRHPRARQKKPTWRR